MAKSPEQMAQAMIDNLPEKTGKTLAQWLKLCKSAKLEKHGEIMKFLKTEHAVTHGFANLISHKFREPAGGAADDDLTAAQYAGPKAGLQPIHDAIVKAALAFGADVEISPKKTYVSLRRNKQFALIQPSTKTRVDLGINLKGEAPDGKLEASGSFNAMVSHRVRLESPKDFNAACKKWLKRAYDVA